MAASTSSVPLHTVSSARTLQPVSARRRRIDPQTGRGLEILAHAIEYLTDEYVCLTHTLSAGAPDVQAIQILMALNRELYYACPMVPSLSDRLRTLFLPRTA